MNVVLGLLLAAAFVHLVATLVFERARGKRMDSVLELALACQNRNRFGELRTELMAAAREGDVDMRRSAPQALYTILTYLMRQPDQYRDAVKLVLTLNEPDDDLEIDFTLRESQLAVRLATALDLLCRDFDPFYRSVAQHLDRHAPGAPLWPFWSSLRRDIEREDRARKALKKVKRFERPLGFPSHPVSA